MSQAKRILAYLLSGETLTPIEALEKFGSFRASERIREIRKMGYEIKNLHPLGTYAKYKLLKKPEKSCTIPSNEAKSIEKKEHLGQRESEADDTGHRARDSHTSRFVLPAERPANAALF